MSHHSCWKHRRGLVLSVAGLALMLARTAPAEAQTSAAGANSGAIRFTGGLDVPSVYVFRGILQEIDPAITLWPYGDIGIALASGEGAVKSVAVNFGVWESLHTGSSGKDFTGHGDYYAHYEEDFYSTLNLGFGGGVGIGLTYMALTSPNGLWNTIQEFQVRATKAHMLSPYGFLAFELNGLDGGGSGADLGSKKGTYLELGVGPAFPLGGGKATLTIPVKAGFSLKDYYESPVTGEDSKFGWFDVGGLFTIPLSKVPSRFGSWNIHGGADVLMFGDTTKFFNVDDNGETSGWKIVFQGGIGLSY